ncbi:MAG: DUF167 domain-containing protein [Candidatus Bathyarchaeota archaeon]|jgi:uncharacterized protein (TIGR00251 family)
MIVTVEVKPGANREEIVKIGDARYRVSVKARRKKGKANAAVLKLLKRHFGKSAYIVRGTTSKTKLIEII